jgi:hypothetical protein
MGPRLRPTFGTLRSYLARLGFVAEPTEKGFTTFRHPEPDTFALFKTVGENEPVREGDLAVARRLLIERGIVTDDEFDQFLVEAILARYTPAADRVPAHAS